MERLTVIFGVCTGGEWHLVPAITPTQYLERNGKTTPVALKRDFHPIVRHLRSIYSHTHNHMGIHYRGDVRAGAKCVVKPS